MRDLDEIRRANAERERREKAGDFEENIYRAGGYEPCEGACGETRVNCKCEAEKDGS